MLSRIGKSPKRSALGPFLQSLPSHKARNETSAKWRILNAVLGCLKRRRRQRHTQCHTDIAKHNCFQGISGFLSYPPSIHRTDNTYPPSFVFWTSLVNFEQGTPLVIARILWALQGHDPW